MSEKSLLAVCLQPSTAIPGAAAGLLAAWGLGFVPNPIGAPPTPSSPVGASASEVQAREDLPPVRIDVGGITPPTPQTTYVWSHASLERGDAVTVHWHECHWANRIHPNNRRSFVGDWAKLPSQVGARVRRCSVCSGLG
jgi:hypothetical protein